jgi:hypothetical protein
MRFSVGVNYWPQRTAHAMWTSFDAGEIAEDFARIAGLGLDTVRFFLRWDAFAPTADSVDETMLTRCEQFVNLAHAAGLQTMPTLFCGQQSGVNFLPAWALDARRPRGASRTITPTGESSRAAGNIYSGALLDAQMHLARTVGERLRGHPGVRAWDIGHAFSDVREPRHGKLSSGDHGGPPVAEAELAAWSTRLATTLRAASGADVTAGTYSGDLLADREIRLGSLCAAFAFASMQGSSVTSRFARNRLDPEVMPFLTMLTAGFSYKPVLVTGFGEPSCETPKFSASERFATADEPPDLTISPADPVFATYPCLTETEQATTAGATLERLHADGRLGAYWWCWADYPDTLAALPPFDQAEHERNRGLIRRDGSLKPVAETIGAFAREQRETVRAVDMPMISSTYYYRTLPTSAHTLFDAFLGFVEARRSTSSR